MNASSLVLIQEQAQQKLRHAQIALREAEKAQAQYQQQLDHLEQYRLDYATTLITRGQEGLNASNFHQLQAFLTQLDQTLSAQRDGQRYFEQQVENCKSTYFQCRKQQNALQHWIDIKQQQQDKILAKKEQKNMDELALYNVLRQQGKAR